jgi:hypothetical protein
VTREQAAANRDKILEVAGCCFVSAASIGPHWMIMWPFNPKTTGLPAAPKDAGAYIVWAGSPYAHVICHGPAVKVANY